MDDPSPNPTDAATERLRRALAIANIPTLLLVLVQMTGATAWLEDPYQPSRARGMNDNDSGGLSPERQAAVRSAALAAILAWRDGRPAIGDCRPLARPVRANAERGDGRDYSGRLRRHHRS